MSAYSKNIFSICKYFKSNEFISLLTKNNFIYFKNNNWSLDKLSYIGTGDFTKLKISKNNFIELFNLNIFYFK